MRRFVSFTGGLGAQILSAAIYFDARQSANPLLADLRYFDQAARQASPGDGSVSIWSWALSPYGIEPHSLEHGIPRRLLDQRIKDGPEKGVLAYTALGKQHIRDRFPLRSDPFVPGLDVEVTSALVIHLRRGDYLNVASHVVSDEDALEAARGFAPFLSTAVVLSDSPVPESTIARLRQHFRVVAAPTGLDDFTTHSIMRRAAVLVASNSQFSLTAALLREGGMSLLPGQWFGKGQASLESVVHGITGFRLLRGVAR